MFAGPEDGQRTVAAGDGWTAGPGLALVTGHRGVAEISAARSLQQIARSRCHVAELGRRSRENGLREHGIISPHRRVVREIRVANGGADLQSAVTGCLDLVEGQAINVEEPRR